MPTHPNRRRFSIVPRRRTSRRLLAACALLWLLSLVAVWQLATRHAAPTLAATRAERDDLRRRVAAAETEVRALRQEVATLGRAEQITRAANGNLQQTLAEREEELAQLRADVSFYERLVGTSGQRRGLSVHSVHFAPGADGLWAYRVTLVQNLNRGKVSRGRMRLSLDGVRAGRLVTLDWGALHQQERTEGESFEFRYFQQLEGRVMLPSDFQPHRVRVSLTSEGRDQDQAFDWDQTLNSAGSAGR